MIDDRIFKCIDCKIPVPTNKIICVSCMHKRNFPAEKTIEKEKEQKRVQLTHGSARVDKDCSPETIKALDEMSKIAFDMDFLEPAYIASESELTFLDYANFKPMTAIFRFISFDQPEFECEKTGLNKWRVRELDQKGFDRYLSAGKTVILIDYNNLTIGRISQIAAMLSRADIEKVADFIYEQKMLIVEKEICSLIGEIDFEDKGFYDELK